MPDAATAELAGIVRAAGADEFADRLDRAISDGVALLALTTDERAIILAQLEDPTGRARRAPFAVLLSEHQWRSTGEHERPARPRWQVPASRWQPPGYSRPVPNSRRTWPEGLPTSIVLRKANEQPLPPTFADDDVRFAESLVELLLDALTDPDDIVLDPFCGFGTTMIVAERMGRRAWGVEIDESRAEYVRARLEWPERLLVGDMRKVGELNLPTAQLVLTSPPYSSPGEPRDALSGYVEPHRGYTHYLSDLARVFSELASAMPTGSWLVVEASNLKGTDGRVTPLAWDIARTVGEVVPFVGELVVTWKPTYGYGYGYDHSYCLVFAP